MDFEKFVKKVKDGAQAYLGDGVSLSVSTVLKNNGVNLTGINFHGRGQRRRFHHISGRAL